MMKIKTFILIITLISLSFARSDSEGDSLSIANSSPKTFTQTPHLSTDLATSLTERPETQLIQKTFEKLSEINPNFLDEKKETVQRYIKESSFFQKNPNVQSAALNYMDAFYYGTKIMKYQVDAGAKLFIPCGVLAIHIATGDVPLAITTGISLASNVVQLIPDAIENWKNIGRMGVSGVKTISSLTKSVFSLFKK